MNKNIKVSICVITYNQAIYIAECLTSLVNQETDFNYEIVIRDDVSSDGTEKIIAQFQEQFPALIKVLDSVTNLGMNKNLLEVFKAAQGEYVALCEGDDYWIDTKKIQKQCTLLEKNQHINICSHPALVKMDSKGYLGSMIGMHGKKMTIIPAREIIANDGGFLATPSLMLRKRCLDNVPFWFASAPLGDYFIQAFASLQEGCLYMPEPMAVYRQNAVHSWSEKMQSYEQKLKFSNAMSLSLDQLTDSLSAQYTSEINCVRSKIWLSLSLAALLHAKDEHFKKWISDSWFWRPKLSFYQRVFYYLRYYPNVLRGVCYLINSKYKEIK